MKYQHYEKYVSAAEKVLPNLPEIFTAKEFDEIRTPIRNEADNKWQYQTLSDLNKMRSNEIYWGYYTKDPAYKEWCEKRDKAYREYKNSIPVSLETLRAHNFVIIDHKEPITVIVNDPWWNFSAPTFYYDGEEVSEKIYNKMKKYEPEKCKKVDGCEVDAWRGYYRVDWDALNEYLAGDTSERSRELLEEIKQKEQEIAELRERRKQECPNWND